MIGRRQRLIWLKHYSIKQNNRYRAFNLATKAAEVFLEIECEHNAVAVREWLAENFPDGPPTSP